MTQVPSIYKDEPGDEFHWEVKNMIQPCYICFAKTTTMWLKKDIPVLNFCYACGTREFFKEVIDINKL